MCTNTVVPKLLKKPNFCVQNKILDRIQNQSKRLRPVFSICSYTCLKIHEKQHLELQNDIRFREIFNFEENFGSCINWLNFY